MAKFSQCQTAVIMTVRAAAEITGQKWIPKELVFEIFDCFMSGVDRKSVV